MTEQQLYFFDTYAFFEIIRGNPQYAKYQNVNAVTTIFNLAELNYGLKKETSKNVADTLTKNYEPLLVTITITDVQEAMTLKTTRRNLSIPDAIGYTVAKRLGALFLTGDSDFETMKEVEYVPHAKKE